MNAKAFKILILVFCCINFSNVYALKPYAIIVHGGAGTYSTDSSENHQIKHVLLSAVEKGYSILESGGSSLDAVESAINILENSFLFNAGRGSVLNEEGFVEMDASIMEGKNLQAGAVAGVRNYPNPISLARLVMEKTPHVLFAGEGINRLLEKFMLPKIPPDSLKYRPKNEEHTKSPKEKRGTVGAVAIDMYGNISAGTSTGGVSNKMVGRVGDSPIIGAGTYAKNSTCGVSCTGLGEFFIRQSAAFQVSALMEFAQYSLSKAVTYVLNEIYKMGASGGIIAIDKDGNPAFDYTTQGMPCAFKSSNGVSWIIIFKNELEKNNHK